MKTVHTPHIDAGIASAAIETVDYTIEASADAFRTLIDGLYTDKVSAVIREISTNAYDAQVEAGRGDVPFEVHLPTVLEPHFSVRDFGTSMTHAKVMEHYTKLFGSDRRSTNDAVGQYGLGSKSPYSISDSFVVTAYLDGEARVYVASLNEEGRPIFSHVSTLPSDEPQGLLVSVTPPESLRGEFLSKARRVYRAFPVEPVTNVPLDIPAPLASGDGWRLYSEPHSDRILVRQGTVEYPTGRYSPLNYGYELVVDVPIGTVAITPSREALQDDPTTREAVTAAVEPVIEDFKAAMISQILAEPTFYQANAAFNRVSTIVFSGLGETLHYGGEDGPVITGRLSTYVEVPNSGTKGKSRKVIEDRVLVTITPGRQSNPPKFLVDRSDAQVLRKQLRISAFGRDYDHHVRVLHNPTPAQVKALIRAYRMEDPSKHFVDITAIPDVEVKRKSSTRTGGAIGVYYPGTYNPLQRYAADPDPGTYIAVPIERGYYKAKLIDSPLSHYDQSELTQVFHTLSRHFSKPVVLLTKAAVKRLKPSEDDLLAAHVERYIDDVLDATLASRRFEFLVRNSHYGRDVIAKVLDEEPPANPPAVPYQIQYLERFREAIDASEESAESELSDLSAKFPLVFNMTETAIIEYIDLLKEEK